MDPLPAVPVRWTRTASVAVFGPTACCASSVCLGPRLRVIGRGNLPSLFANLGRWAGVGNSLLSLDGRASVATGTVMSVDYRACVTPRPGYVIGLPWWWRARQCLWTAVLAFDHCLGMSVDYRGGGGLGNVFGLPCLRQTLSWYQPYLYCDWFRAPFNIHKFRPWLP